MGGRLHLLRAIRGGRGELGRARVDAQLAQEIALTDRPMDAQPRLFPLLRLRPIRLVSPLLQKTRFGVTTGHGRQHPEPDARL